MSVQPEYSATAEVVLEEDRFIENDSPDTAPEIANEPLELETSTSSTALLEQAAADNSEYIRAGVRSDMAVAGARFNVALASTEIVTPDNTKVNIVLKPNESAAVSIDGWRPGSTSTYAGKDPFRIANPEVVKATEGLIKTTMEVADRVRDSRDPALSYNDLRRSAGGKRDTEITAGLKGIDTGFREWITGLPAAEQLRPIAHPEFSSNIKCDKSGAMIPIEISDVTRAMATGSRDGWAVREREAWEGDQLKRRVDPADLVDGTLRITSLGTGTGEPAMDSGLSVVEQSDGKVVATGVDLMPPSLAVAQYLAGQKKDGLANPDALEFKGIEMNILSDKAALAKVVRESDPHVIESIGFTEYVPSANPTNPLEQKQRHNAERMGWMTAEEYLKTVYDAMPEGSVFLTGNMRDDSPEASFVIDGLGWSGIIQRSSDEYLRVLRDSGIPAESIDFYEPDADPEESAGVYNLVAITKH